MNFPFQYCNILYQYTISNDVKKIVELGTGTGCSTEAFGEALKLTNGTLWSVDLYRCDETRIRLRHLTEKINFITMDSVEYAKSWDQGKIDILLCDSDHSYERVTNELNAWIKYEPKIIFVHDTLFADSSIAPPYIAASNFANNNNLTFTNYDFMHGLGMIIKK